MQTTNLKSRQVFDDSARIDRIPHWFKGVHLNYAENILFTADPKAPHSLGTQGKEENKVAIIEAREWAKPKTVTWGELRIYVGRLSAALRSAGVRKGNVVAAVVSNSFDALCIFLSTTALGGIFTSASPDMGSQGILDRLLQVSPKLLFFDDSAGYNGKTLDLRPKLSEIAPKLQGHDWFHGVVTIPRYHTPADVSGLHGVEQFHEFVQRANSTELCFERVDFGHPFLIVYSSGTTGAPKCIAHSTGGVILAAYREGSLHRNLGPESIMMQFTTTAWIMYLISINSLLLGSTCVLYDGNPFFPAKDSFIRLASELR
jgi:acetoacetyl-CoA synthetase